MESEGYNRNEQLNSINFSDLHQRAEFATIFDTTNTLPLIMPNGPS